MKPPSLKRVAKGRVAAGAAYLDVVVGPQWVDRIDLKVLDLGSTQDCVVGQLVGDYMTSAIGIADGSVLGFDVVESRSVDDVEMDYDKLTREWVKIIRRRRREHKAAAAK